MFDFFRKHMRVLQFVLVLLIFPSFIFFGIQGYSRFTEGSNATVAKVDGQPITQAEWDAAHREQVERLRRQQPTLDASLLDSLEARRRTLEELVRDRVLLIAADALHLTATDERLQRIFRSDPQFAFLRNPDGSVNQDALAAQGMSSETFARRLRLDLSRRQVLAGVAGSAFATAGTVAAAFDPLLQRREVQVVRFDAKDQAAQATPSDQAVERYYADPAHAAQYTAPEQATIEYVVLDLAALGKDLKVSEDELRKYYAENLARYTVAEERRASHILVKAEKSAPAADRAKARAKAEALLAEVRRAPASFAELAKKHSDDPGSAAKGGDLDFFGRGAMVKPFEDAAFALKPGEIGPLIESDFGYHIVRLDAVRGGEKRSFESVRGELAEEVGRQLAQRRYAEAAVEFTNLVYEQPDSLKPVADKLKLDIRTAQGVQRTPAAGASGPLASPKFLQALFSGDALRNKRNTEAVETAANQLVSGRIVSYLPARRRPLAEVRDSVRAAVIATQAAQAARKAGLARLDELRKSPRMVIAEPAITVSRVQPQGLPRPLLDAVLRADASLLPVSVGVDLGQGGYAIARVNRVLGRDPAAADQQQMGAQYAQAWGAAETLAYYNALRSRFNVDVKVPETAAGTLAASTAAVR
jgi:peptidyl-prolyl cis-trans isomerase D